MAVGQVLQVLNSSVVVSSLGLATAKKKSFSHLVAPVLSQSMTPCPNGFVQGSQVCSSEFRIVPGEHASTIYNVVCMCFSFFAGDRTDGAYYGARNVSSVSCLGLDSAFPSAPLSSSSISHIINALIPSPTPNSRTKMHMIFTIFLKLILQQQSWLGSSSFETSVENLSPC